MAKLLNCCGEADHLIFCNHEATLLTYSIQYSRQRHKTQDTRSKTQYILIEAKSLCFSFVKTFLFAVALFPGRTILHIIKKYKVS